MTGKTSIKFDKDRDGWQDYPIGSIADLSGNRLDFERQGGVLTAINESAGGASSSTPPMGASRPSRSPSPVPVSATSSRATDITMSPTWSP